MYYELLSRNVAMTVDIYCQQLRCLAAVIEEKRPGRLHQVLLQHDNAHPHSANIRKAVIQEFDWEFRHPVGEIKPSTAFCYELQTSGKSCPQQVRTSFDVVTSDGSLPKANQTIGLPLLHNPHVPISVSKCIHLSSFATCGNLNSNRYIRDVLDPRYCPSFTQLHMPYFSRTMPGHMWRGLCTPSSKNDWYHCFPGLQVRQTCRPSNVSEIWLVGNLFVIVLQHPLMMLCGLTNCVEEDFSGTYPGPL
ncbi:hypothetical protein ANN_01462 [Periplaneta americana]|uniref:Mariner Mos1 transposase n=1 Tax=Periplaneta americana TaxID=6978 RepID=A0ABQ8TTM9_PERAM|nr:hypothetical protein ANN_01462 [Periplaneta americana]